MSQVEIFNQSGYPGPNGELILYEPRKGYDYEVILLHGTSYEAERKAINEAATWMANNLGKRAFVGYAESQPPASSQYDGMVVYGGSNEAWQPLIVDLANRPQFDIWLNHDDCLKHIVELKPNESFNSGYKLLYDRVKQDKPLHITEYGNEWWPMRRLSASEQLTKREANLNKLRRTKSKRRG